MPRANGFLNVDLEIGARTRARLAPLVDVLEDKLVELHRGRIRDLYRVHYENSECNTDASAAILRLVAVVEALKRPARDTWDAAIMRDFNIGIELAPGVRKVELAIEPDAARRVIALGGRIAVTAYQVAAMPSLRRKMRS